LSITNTLRPSPQSPRLGAMTMGDYEIGRGKPPRLSQFKKGNRANPNGRRGKRKPVVVADIIENVLNGLAEYRERGRTKKAKRRMGNKDRKRDDDLLDTFCYGIAVSPGNSEGF
jgi:hypothetical protein